MEMFLYRVDHEKETTLKIPYSDEIINNFRAFIEDKNLEGEYQGTPVCDMEFNADLLMDLVINPDDYDIFDPIMAHIEESDGSIYSYETHLQDLAFEFLEDLFEDTFCDEEGEEYDLEVDDGALIEYYIDD